MTPQLTVPPSPRQRLEALDALDGRHHARVAMLDSVALAEQRLRKELHHAPVLHRKGFWSRVRARWSPPPPSQASGPTERHESMVRAVRALSFHLVALEGAVSAVLHDQAELRSLAHPSELESAATPPFLAARIVALVDLLQVEHSVLTIRHEGLLELHGAAHDVAHALSRQALHHHMAVPRTARSASLDTVVQAAIERAAELHHRVDSQESRMRQLDEEARARRVAQAEVEVWLRPAAGDE